MYYKYMTLGDEKKNKTNYSWRHMTKKSTRDIIFYHIQNLKFVDEYNFNKFVLNINLTFFCL